MKSKLTGILVLASLLASRSLMANDEPIFVYLIDPKDKETIKAFADDSKVTDKSTDQPTPSTNVPNASSVPEKRKRTIDDILTDLNKKPPLTKSQERILKTVTADQMEFLHLLDQFLQAAFDPNDDQATPEFNQVRDKIVKILFDSPEEKFFYERLFLINKSWLDHSTEIARYTSLDKALRDRSLELQERSRRYRQIIMGVTAVGGAVGGGFLSYKAAQKILPVVATEGGFSQIVRWAGRGTIVFIGVGVGAAVGAELGFLGSEYLFERRDYIDPIDGSQDLRDLLDMIEKL